jgi:hypothetical protein
MKITAFWDVTSCNVVERNIGLGGTCSLQLQSRRPFSIPLNQLSNGYIECCPWGLKWLKPGAGHLALPIVTVKMCQAVVLFA